MISATHGRAVLGKFLCLVFCLCLSACSSYYRESSFIYDSVLQRDPSTALIHLESQSPKNRDTVLYNLNKALLLQMQSSYQESNAAFELAKQEMQRLEATSVIENIESVTLNEGRRSYAGQPYERLLLHVYMALNYVMLGDLLGARVEVMQADLKMREWASSKKVEGVGVSAFARYFSGLVFEMNHEMDEALIAYRKAYQVYRENQLNVPSVLRQDLLRLTHRFELTEEFERYSKEFLIGDSFLNSDISGDHGELIYIQNEGLVSRLAQHSIDAFSPGFEKFIRVAVPYYPLNQIYALPGHQRITVNDKQYVAAPIESIDQLARANLSQRMPAIIARAVARAAVKYKVVDKAGDEHPLLGLIGNVATVISETADTRSWSILPARINIARIPLSSGRYQAGIPGSGSKVDVEIKAAKKTVLLAPYGAGTLNVARHGHEK